MTGLERSAIQRAADGNMVAAYLLLAGYMPSPAAVETFGGAIVGVTGIPSPFFNPVLCVGDELRDADLRKAVEFAAERGVRPSLQVRTDLAAPAERVADELGFERDDPDTPGMVLDPVPRDLPTPPAELRILPVTDDPSADSWAAAGSLGAVLPRAFIRDPSIRGVVGSVDGVPLTHAFVTVSDGAMGVYAVGTTESARRRGYGAAITWAAIAAGREAWGEMPVVLQATEMGLPVYLKMGFREICRYAIWYPPKPTERDGTADASPGS